MVVQYLTKSTFGMYTPGNIHPLLNEPKSTHTEISNLSPQIKLLEKQMYLIVLFVKLAQVLDHWRDLFYMLQQGMLQLSRLTADSSLCLR